MSITFEEFKKLEMRISKVLGAEKLRERIKLLKLEVDFGPSTSSGQVLPEQNLSDSDPISIEENLDKFVSADSKNLEHKEQDTESSKKTTRQIVSGIAEFYSLEDLIGKKFPFVVNLEPRVIRGLKSQGMIMAADDNGKVVLLNPDKDVAPVTLVR